MSWMLKGYRFHSRHGRNVREHVEVAERALGKQLPKGAVVHHVNENRADNRPENLVICPNDRYHKLLHTRLNALKACGNPDWRKCPYCGEHDDPAVMRGEKCGRFVHRECSARARQAAFIRRRERDRLVQTGRP